MNFLKHLVVLSSALFSVNVFAQDETTETATSVEDVKTEASKAEATAQKESSGKYKNVEKLEVTGSHIKRIDVEGPSPVLTLDKEYLNRSGYNSVGDVLRDSTITAQGVGRESSGSSTSGSSTAGLRGFGPDKILVLLNGTRLPKIGGDNAVDLNLIPFEAIDRVEILKDGASAIYGSDALAGVINFITLKDYDGATINMRYSAPEKQGGTRQDISAVYGKNFSKGNILAIYQYRSNEEIKDAQRDWSSPGKSFLGSPGSYRPDGGNWLADPTCPADQQESIGANTYCTYDYTPYSWMLPAIEQHSAILSGAYDINESIGMYGTATYTRRQSRWQFAPAPDVFQNANGGSFQVPNATNSLPGWGLPGIGASDFDLRYRLVDELGPRSNRDETDSYGGTLGIRGYLSDTWEWDFSATYGASKVFNDGHAGYANKNTLFTLMNNGTWTPFNGVNKGSVGSALHRAEQWIDSSLTMAQFKASGEVTSVGSGMLTAATGVSAAWENFDQRVDSVTEQGALYGGAGSSGKASRNYQSFFTELALAISDWEFQLAGRFDSFSDFGETVNPKFAFRYKPIESVMFRGSVGTGFKAPTLNELYGASGYGYPWYTDIIACDNLGGAFCNEQQYKTLTGGNESLKQETSFSYNFGSIVQPSRNLTLSLDYWYTEINDAIGLNLDDLILAEKKLGPSGIEPLGVKVIRDSNGEIVEAIAPSLNLAQQKADGLEFSLDYTLKLAGVTITPHIDHTHLLSYLEEPFPGIGLISKLGEAGRPRWRNTSYVTTNFGSNSIRFTGRTIAGQFKKAHTADRSDPRKTATYTEYDINYTYSGSWGGKISLGSKNLFGSDRPLDTTAGFANRLNSSLYDQVGRLYYLGYSQTF